MNILQKAGTYNIYNNEQHKYRIQFSPILNKIYGCENYSTTSSKDKQEYLQQIRYQLHVYNHIQPQLLNGNNINIYEV